MRKLSLLSVLLISACTVGPDYKMPSFELPESWGFSSKPEEAPTPPPQEMQEAWWELFNDAALNDLEKEGLAANGDIALAAARVAEARAVLQVTDADLYPTLSAQAGADRTGPSKETYTGSLSGGKPYNTFSVAAVLDYEIDLWGKLRRASEASRAQLVSEQANHDAVRLAVATDIANAYFTLRALDDQIRITGDTIKARQAEYDYQNKQYKVGVIDVLTLRRADAELAAAQAALPSLTQARVEQQNALSILLGHSPKAIVEAPLPQQKTLVGMPVPPVMPKDAPSSLLQRRPDIAAAEQQLVQANALIGIARADYYPNLSLSALLGLASQDIDRVLRSSAKSWDAGVSSAMPILDFGRVSGNVEAAEARAAQALANYQQVVRKGFVDVANALSRVETTQARVVAQTREVDANQETYRVAGLRYDAGYATQLDLLDAQRQLFQSQLDLISALQARLSATVTLEKALGGGWNAAPRPPEEAKSSPKE